MKRPEPVPLLLGRHERRCARGRVRLPELFRVACPPGTEFTAVAFPGERALRIFPPPSARRPRDLPPAGATLTTVRLDAGGALGIPRGLCREVFGTDTFDATLAGELYSFSLWTREGWREYEEKHLASVTPAGIAGILGRAGL